MQICDGEHMSESGSEVELMWHSVHACAPCHSGLIEHEALCAGGAQGCHPGLEVGCWQLDKAVSDLVQPRLVCQLRLQFTPQSSLALPIDQMSGMMML